MKDYFGVEIVPGDVLAISFSTWESVPVFVYGTKQDRIEVCVRSFNGDIGRSVRTYVWVTAEPRSAKYFKITGLPAETWKELKAIADYYHLPLNCVKA